MSGSWASLAAGGGRAALGPKRELDPAHGEWRRLLPAEPGRRMRRRWGPERTTLFQKAGDRKSCKEGLALGPSPPVGPAAGSKSPPRAAWTPGGSGAGPAGAPGRGWTRANFAGCRVAAWWVFFPSTGGEPAAVAHRVPGHTPAGPGPPRPWVRSRRGRRTEGRLARGLGTCSAARGGLGVVRRSRGAEPSLLGMERGHLPLVFQMEYAVQWTIAGGGP